MSNNKSPLQTAAEIGLAVAATAGSFMVTSTNPDLKDAGNDVAGAAQAVVEDRQRTKENEEKAK